MLITADFLHSLCPRPSDKGKRAIYDAYVEALLSPEAEELFTKFGLIHKRRIAHLFGQWPHECGGFTLIWESGQYSATRVMQIFGVGKHSAAVTASEAKKLAGNGPALFERVYGLGNPKKARELGNTKPGDGWRCRGLGIVQITGRGAHEKYAAKIGCSVEDLAKPINSIHAALLEWNEKNCNPIADSEDGTDRALRGITKRINGGYNGLAERRSYFRKATKLLAATPAPVTRSVTDRPPILEIGEDSDDVRQLQELLCRAGYVVPVDGRMGDKTEAALSGFQVNHGLVASGRADDATWEMLKAVTAEGNKTPKTRQVDETKLAKESVAWRLLGRIRTIVTWVRNAILGITIGEASGLEVVESTISAFKRVGAIWREMDLPDALNSTSALLILLAGGTIFGLWLIDRYAKRAQEARKDDAEIGGNLAI
jgi:putative chitinase